LITSSWALFEARSSVGRFSSSVPLMAQFLEGGGVGARVGAGGCNQIPGSHMKHEHMEKAGDIRLIKHEALYTQRQSHSRPRLPR
jgi:hypothetical protein